MTHTSTYTVVRVGWAIDCPKYSAGCSAADQDHARANHLGLWREGVSFELPWDWRHGVRDACMADVQANTARDLSIEELSSLCPGLFPAD